MELAEKPGEWAKVAEVESDSVAGSARIALHRRGCEVATRMQKSGRVGIWARVPLDSPKGQEGHLRAL